MNVEKTDLKMWQRMVASSTGAIITSILVTPLDVIKIRMQSQRKPLSHGDCFIYCNGLMDHVCQYIDGNNKPVIKKNIRFMNSFDAFQKIVKTEGTAALWSGLSPTLVLAVPQVVIYYTLNDWFKHILGYDNYGKIRSDTMSLKYNNSTFNKDDLIPPACAMVARCVAQTVIAPIELVRTKMQSKKLSYREVKTITSTAIRQAGISILWRGLGPTMWRDLPYTVSLWFIYEYLKRRYIASRSDFMMNQPIPYHLTFFYSGCGGIVAGIISHPFDVTKTHRQIELGNAILYNKKISSSTWTYLKMLRKSEGISSLYSGFFPRMFRVVIATSTMITIFETIKYSFIHDYN